MRWLRLGLALLRARFRGRLSVSEPSKLSFRAWLTDVDASVMNHAALMTVMEAGRIDFMVRSGFFALARKQGWFFPSKSISVQFHRPLKLFQKAQLTTRVLHVDPRWIYVGQIITRAEKLVATCIVKSTIKHGKESVPTARIAEALGMDDLPVDSPDRIDALDDLDQLVHHLMQEAVR